MNKVTLQIPLQRQVKVSAEKVATEQGFSSLQEVVRVFLTQFAAKKVAVSWQEPIYLSDANEKRYTKMSDDFRKGKDTFSAKDAKELFTKLHDDMLS